MNPKDRRT